MNDPSANANPTSSPRWIWCILLIIIGLIVLFALLLFQKYSIPRVNAKPASEWIHWRIAEKNPAIFDEAKQALGQDVWDYLEVELSLRDNLLDRCWRRLSRMTPDGIFKSPKTANERVLDALILLEKMRPIHDQIQPSLISIIEGKAILGLTKIFAVRILDVGFEELTERSIKSIQASLKATNPPDLRLASYCLLLKRDIVPNLLEEELIGLVPGLTLSSISEIRWLICHSKIDVAPFWTEHLKLNNNTTTHFFTPSQLSIILDKDRKIKSVTAGLNVYDELSGTIQNQILSAISSYRDLFARETIVSESF